MKKLFFKISFITIFFIIVFLSKEFAPPFFPMGLRKLLFLFYFFSLFIFRIPASLAISYGLFILLGVSIFSFLSNFGMVDKLVVYAWGFLLFGGILQGWELWRNKREK